MDTDLHTLLKRILLCLMVLVCALFVRGLSTAKGRTEGPRIGHPSNLDQREEDMAKILSVVEKRCEDPRTAEKVKDKLFGMSQKQIRLMVSLSDLVANNGNIPGAEIVFFTVTMLIIVS